MRSVVVRPSRVTLLLSIVVGLVGSVVVATPARADRTFGAGPTTEVIQAARDHKSDCSTPANRLTTDQLVALVLAPTFPETGAPPSSSPAPMTMSRYDNQDALHSFANPDTYRDAFWHPGIGPWQWDDASLRGFTSFDRIDARFIADYTAAYIASRWCSSPSFGSVWAPWHGCRNGNCKAIYDELLVNGQLTGLAREAAVGVLGGMEAHTCTEGSATTFRCWFVDPDRAQGYDGFARPGFGPAPITAPFVAYRADDTAHRHWLQADTGYGVDIQASLRLGLNSRSGSLVWERGSTLCDLTRRVGLCDPMPPAGFDLATERVNGIYQPMTADFDGDGRGDIFWYGPGTAHDAIWSGTSERSFRSAAIVVSGTYQPVTGDFDGDGRGDVLWYGPGTDPDAIWYGRRDGRFDYGAVTVNGTYQPMVGDYDGDGRDDVFWYAPGATRDSQWYGTAARSWQFDDTQVRGTYEPVVGNFDGAAGDDVFWYAPGADGDSSWYSRGDRTFRAVDVNVNGVYDPVAGDFDDDGRDDIVWYAQGPASDSLWTAAGSGFTTERIRIEGAFTLLGADFDGADGDDVFFYRPGRAYDAIWWQAG